MLKLNMARLEEEMRVVAEDRIRSVAGDSPMLTVSQTARAWNKAPGWVAKMMKEGRVPYVAWGSKPGIQRAVVVMGLVKGL